MRLLTKEQRYASRDYQFNKLVSDGYTREDYKDLVIFTHPTNLFLKTFYGSAANHTDFYRYRSIEQLNLKVVELKKNKDSRDAFKLEQKEKNKGKVSSHAAAANAIKAELNKAFAGIKFSVKSSSFSMGNSVDISWTDGPTVREVEAISQKYQYGHFNGMEDIYENTNWRDDIPQAKYVTESRTQSENISKLLPSFEAFFSAEQLTDWNNKPENILYRIWNNTSFPASYDNLEIVRTECTCGQWEEFYKITFTSLEVESVNTSPIEVEKGKIQVIEHPKRDGKILVIGETYPIKSNLKELGGWWNKWEKGWEYRAADLANVTNFLKSLTQQTLTA